MPTTPLVRKTPSKSRFSRAVEGIGAKHLLVLDLVHDQAQGGNTHVFSALSFIASRRWRTADNQAISVRSIESKTYKETNYV